MKSECVIKDCKIEWENNGNSTKIPKFSLPKNKDIQNKWFQNIGSSEVCEKLKAGAQICLIHFENHYIENNIRIHPSAVPTLKLNKGNTFVDYEELLSTKPPTKKKRGTSGLMNLQIARRKKLMRRERMRRLAEMRRLTKLESQKKEKPKFSSKTESSIPASPQIYDIKKDYFLGERTETDNERIVISLRLTSLMKHLYDGKTTFTKHPASIRDIKTYPIFNKICKIQELLSPENPVFWNCNQVQTFIEKIVDQKGLIKRIEMHEIDGESLMSLNKSDLENHFDLDYNIAKVLGDACEQLKKETIMRFVNS